ncbi:MAG: HPr family phosphocarrier protein [Phycisphaerales bacterium]|nr:HPr family phosphocarrier protein [Phycisphaerales bacterium]
MSNTDSAIVTISNRLGLHARPEMMLAEAAMRYESDVTLQRLDQEKAVDAKSIMQLMMLAAVCGTELKVEAHGSDAAESVAAIQELVKNSFNEDSLDG